MVEIFASDVPKTFPELYAGSTGKVNSYHTLPPKPFLEIWSFSPVSTFEAGRLLLVGREPPVSLDALSG